MTPEHDHLADIEKKLDRVITLLDGDNGHPGLRVRVDRVEQVMKFAGWILGVIFVAVVGLVVDNIRQ